MKKILIGLIFLIAAIIVPSGIAKADDNTQVNVGVSSSGDMEVWLDVDAEGNISIIIDGVPIEAEFANISSAINHMSSIINSNQNNLNSKINSIKSSVNNNTNLLDQQTYVISIHENKLDILLSNTIHNKNDLMALENQHNTLKTAHTELLTDYIALSTSYSKLQDNYQGFSQAMLEQVNDLETRSGTLEKHRTYTTAGVVVLVAILGLAFRKGIGGSIGRGARGISARFKRNGNGKRKKKSPRRN